MKQEAHIKLLRLTLESLKDEQTELSLESFRLASEGRMSVKDARMTYSLRNANLKKQGRTLHGFKELEEKLSGLPDEKMLGFAHYRNDEVLVSIFHDDGALVGFFSLRTKSDHLGAPGLEG